MIKISEIYSAINDIAPFDSAMSFDNVGLLIGSMETKVKKALICLDITETTIEEAIKINAELIISHHPVIFHGLKKIDESSVQWKLIKNNISAICCHTNLDFCDEIGVNKALANCLKLQNLQKCDDYYTATTVKCTSENFACHIKNSLNTTVGFNNIEKNIETVAFCSGAGGSAIYKLENIDALVCGEARHDEVLEATRKNIAIFIAGHYETEKIFDQLLNDYLKDKIKNVEFILSKNEKSPLKYL